MTVVWGIVGMLVGVIIASQLAWPELNLGIPFLSYGRLRPLHTNAVIFAFGGCALFATSYYVVQRTSHARLFSDALAAFTFWGWQAVIVLAAITLPLGRKALPARGQKATAGTTFPLQGMDELPDDIVLIAHRPEQACEDHIDGHQR